VTDDFPKSERPCAGMRSRPALIRAAPVAFTLPGCPASGVRFAVASDGKRAVGAG